jgi:hypothetical protein
MSTATLARTTPLTIFGKRTKKALVFLRAIRTLVAIKTTGIERDHKLAPVFVSIEG